MRSGYWITRNIALIWIHYICNWCISLPNVLGVNGNHLVIYCNKGGIVFGMQSATSFTLLEWSMQNFTNVLELAPITTRARSSRMDNMLMYAKLVETNANKLTLGFLFWCSVSWKLWYPLEWPYLRWNGGIDGMLAFSSTTLLLDNLSCILYWD